MPRLVPRQRRDRLISAENIFYKSLACYTLYSYLCYVLKVKGRGCSPFNQKTLTKMKTVMTVAHKLVRANRFFGVAKYRELFSVALKQAWSQVRRGVEEITADAVKTFADNAGCAAFAYIANPKFIEVTIRGKKTDKVYINLDARKVSFKGLGASLANKIADQFNLSIAY